MSRRRTSLAPVTPIDNEDLLHEILFRLPPKPSSLPRASLVCKRWRSILSDQQFLKRFRKHHRKPPLLGFFVETHYGLKHVFNPILNTPNRIPSARFSVPDSHVISERWIFTGCRHGLAVLVCPSRHKIVVWDPLTSQRHHVNFPPGIAANIWNSRWHASVICVDSTDGHVHGDCFSSPFKLVLTWVVESVRSFACLYESATGVWENIISTKTTETISCYAKPGVRVGNTLCWLICGGDILAFDFAMNSLGVIDKPTDNHVTYGQCVQLLRMEDGGLGLAVLSELTVKLWERRSDCDGFVGWVLLQKTIPLEGMLPRGMSKSVFFVGYDEETNVIVLTTMVGNYLLQVDSMQIRHIVDRTEICFDTFYPYTNFYTAGRGVGWKWVDLKL